MTILLLVIGWTLVLVAAGALLVSLMFLASGYVEWDLWLFLLAAVVLPTGLGCAVLSLGFRRLESPDLKEPSADPPS